jgi:hypothetical protein
MGTGWQTVLAVLLPVLLPVLLVAATSLIIPLAIVLGHRHPTGALLLSGGGALGAFSALWLVFDGSRLLDGPNAPLDGGMIPRVLLIVLGTFLLIAAWTLSLNAAVQARRWEWLVLLILAGFLSFAALFAVLFLQDACLIPGSLATYGPCTLALPAQLPIMVGSLAGPMSVLAYRLRGSVPWRVGLPEGLSISRLGTADDAGEPARQTD